jgi:predicted GTPase
VAVAAVTCPQLSLAGEWCKQSDNNKKKIANEKTESYVQFLSNYGNYKKCRLQQSNIPAVCKKTKKVHERKNCRKKLMKVTTRMQTATQTYQSCTKKILCTTHKREYTCRGKSFTTLR